MKCTITIEDLPNGNVKIVCNPSFETMAKMIKSGEDVTSAMGYAVAMANRAREVGKQKGPIVVSTPRIETFQ